MNPMNQSDLLNLAAHIYALDVVLHPDWDLQKKAREAIKTAMQFALAAQAEQAAGNIESVLFAQHRLPPASPSVTELLAQAHHQRPLQPGNTMASSAGTAVQGSTAEAVAATAPGTALDAGTGSPSKQSQEQDASRGIQTQPYAPYDEDLRS